MMRNGVSLESRQNAMRDLWQAAGYTIASEWLDLRRLTEYAAVSNRTLRAWIHLPVDPLPAVRVGTKILVGRREFDAWLEQRKVKPLDLEVIVEELVGVVTDGR